MKNEQKTRTTKLTEEDKKRILAENDGMTPYAKNIYDMFMQAVMNEDISEEEKEQLSNRAKDIMRG